MDLYNVDLVNMNPPIDDEDCLDDPIQLNFIEDTPPIDNLQFLDTGIIDLDSGEDCEIIDDYNTLQSENHRHQVVSYTQSLQKVTIKLVDCLKFHWYYDRVTRDIIDRTLANMGIDNNSRIVTEANKDEYEIEIVHLDTKVDSIPETQQNTKEKTIDAHPRKNIRIKKNELELKNAITQRNKTEIDLKRNKGLVGMKIQKSQAKGIIEKNDTQADINKLRYVDDLLSEPLTAALLNVGTSITPVFEDSIEKIKKNKRRKSISCDLEKSTSSLRSPNVEEITKNTQHEIAKDERKDDVNSFMTMYNNIMKVSQEIVKEVIGTGNQNDLTVGKQQKFKDKANFDKEKSFGKKKTTEAKQTKKDKGDVLNTSNQQKNAECCRTTKLITAIPLISKKRRERFSKHQVAKEKCDKASKLSNPITSVKSKKISVSSIDKNDVQHLECNKEDTEIKKISTKSIAPKKTFDVPLNKFTEYILHKVNMQKTNDSKETKNPNPLEGCTNINSKEKKKLSGKKIASTDKLFKKIPQSEQNRESNNTSSVILPTANNNAVPTPLNAVKAKTQDSQPKLPQQLAVLKALKNKRKQSFSLASDERISSIENYMKNKSRSKPIQAVAPEIHAKSPPELRKEIFPIQTILTDRKNLNSEKPMPLHKQIPSQLPANSIQPVQAQMSKPLTVHNSMQSHILYSPQTSPRPAQSQMSPDASTLRYHLPMQQLNQSLFMYQPPGLMQSIPTGPPPSVYKQGSPQMFHPRQMHPGLYDVRPNKVFWPYTYPPPPLPPPPPPLPPPSPTKKSVDPLRLSAVTQSYSSIIGKNNDGVIKKITITSPSNLKDTNAKHNIIKIENISDPISTSLYNEMSSVAKNTVPVSTKSEIRKVLDTSSFRQVNTPERIGTTNDNLKRPYPADFIANAIDNSKTKRSLSLNKDPIAEKKSKSENPVQSTTSPKTSQAEFKESFVINSISAPSMQGESTAANVLNRAVQKEFMSQPNDNLSYDPKKSISESQKGHHTNSVKTVKSSKKPETSKVKHNNHPIKRKQLDTRTLGDLFEIPLPNNNTPLPVRYKPGPLSKKSKLIDTRVSPDENKVSNEKSSKKYSLPILPIPTYEKILSEVSTPTQRRVKNNDYNSNFKERLDDRRIKKDEIELDNYRSSKKKIPYEYEQSKKCESAKKISLDEYKKRTLGERKPDDEVKAYILKQNDSFKKKTDEMPRRVSNVDSDLGYDSDSTVKL